MKLDRNPSERPIKIDEKMKIITIQKTEKNKAEISLKLKTLLIMTILVITILTPTAKAAPQIQLISQLNPLEYGSTQRIILNITTNDNNTPVVQTRIEINQQNNTLQKTTGQYEYSWTPQQTGTNVYTVYATNALNETQTYTNTFTVADTTPPRITETNPQGNLNYNLVELKAITNENSTCRYDTLNASYGSMTYPLSGTELNHTQLRNFWDGSYTLYVQCKDMSNNPSLTKTINFNIDTTPPSITGINPAGTLTQPSITLQFNTDETARCKWGKTKQDYEHLENQIQTTGTTTHQQNLDLTEGINTYYLSCKDSNENKNPAITINLELDLPPTANIEIKKNDSYPAIKQGTYELILTTSKQLSQPPSLQLKYANQQINIPLEGSGQQWKGYLIINQEAGENVGEFIYSGVNTKGTTGKEVTEGKLLLIDTIPPQGPSTLNLLNTNNKIKLSWDYTGEEPNHFNLYKSTTGKTDKSNFETTTTEKSYWDSKVTNKIGYFYRVSAVDKAGNEGPLTDEEFIMTAFQDINNEIKQDPAILAIINNKISELETTTQDLELKINQLEEIADQDLLLIINERQLIKGQKETQSKLQTLIGELKTYKGTTITSEDLNAKIQIIDSKFSDYKKGIIKEVTIKDKIEKTQNVEQTLTQEIINEYLRNRPLTEEQRKEYGLQTKRLQQDIKVSQEILSYEIIYQYKQSENVILIKETLNSEKNLGKTIIQEYLPKDLIKISDINFSASPSDINNLGVQWAVNDPTSKEIIYTINLDKELSQLQMIRTVLLYDIEEFLSDLSNTLTNNTNQVTGKSVNYLKKANSLKKATLPAIGVLIISLLGVYYFVFLKTENKYEDSIEKELSERQKNTGFDEFSEEKKNVPELKASIKMIFSLLEQADERINCSDIESASNLYASAILIYSQTNFTISDKIKANYAMNTLREKIIKLKKPKHLYS
jgi:hypothetical protein